MPIRAECSCGKVYNVKDEIAGKRFRCGSCGETVPVPTPEEEPMEVALADEEEPRPRRRSRSTEENEDRPRRPVRFLDDDEPEDEERERPSKKKKKRPSSRSGGGGGSGIAVGPVLGGLLAMVGAVVWFVVGLMNNYIFFYPPVLFVLGLVALIKGLMGQE